MSKNLLLPLCLSLPLFACGGGSDPATLTDDGYAALGSGDWSGAQESFEQALAGMTPEDSGWLRAKMGHVEALIGTDAERAKNEFLALAEQGKVGAKDFRTIGSKMTNEKEFVAAVDVLDAGVKAHPDDEKMIKLIEVVKAEAERSGDAGALDKLSGLGYIGD